MISYADIQIAYNNLYKEARKYIWGFSAVEALSDLEVATYQTCPDLVSIRSALYRFRQYASDILPEDDDFTKAFDRFQDLVNGDDSVYAKLNQVKEVIQK